MTKKSPLNGKKQWALRKKIIKTHNDQNENQYVIYISTPLSQFYDFEERALAEHIALAVNILFIRANLRLFHKVLK